MAPPADSAPGFGEASERFGLWLARHRGLKTVTIRGYQRYLRPFLVALGEDPAAYGSARISDFMIQHLAKRGRDDATHTVRAIRSYLRYLVALGRVPCGLAHCVPTVPQWHLSALPRYLEFADVERVIASCDVSTIKGLRDRAIILLLARLGVRSRDIIAMLLTDVDGERGTLRVRGKSTHGRSAPHNRGLGIMDEGDATGLPLGLRASIAVVPKQRAAKDFVDTATQVVVVSKPVAQCVRDREHPLSHQNVREHVIGQLCGAFGHSATAATFAKAAPLTG
jgi:integrase